MLGAIRGSDIGSGTVGSALALVMSLALAPLGWGVQAVVTVVVMVASVWSARPFAVKDGDGNGKEGDPGWVVVDEAAGTFLATVSLSVPAAIVAWVVFRIADIFKRAFPGVAAAERLPGAIGVTADDLVAGLYGLAAGLAADALWFA